MKSPIASRFRPEEIAERTSAERRRISAREYAAQVAACEEKSEEDKIMMKVKKDHSNAKRIEAEYNYAICDSPPPVETENAEIKDIYTGLTKT